jgi:hypothetical protein
MAIVATRMMTGRSGRLPADWSWQRKASLIAFALMMTYLHSLYILFFYVTDWDYWWPFWTGMTVEQRLFSYALALFANLGLIAMPFVRAPGRILRAVIALSLTMGLLVSIAWLARDLGTFGLLGVGLRPTTEHIGRFLADVILLVSPILLRALFASAIFLNSWLLFNLVKRPEDAGESKHGR